MVAPAGPPVIGKDIPWKRVEGWGLRVTHFTAFASVKGNKVKAYSRTLPYAILTVDHGKLPSETKLYVTHKEDFRHLWQAYEERGISEDEWVVVYDFNPMRPRWRRLLAFGLPRLLVSVWNWRDSSETPRVVWEPRI